MTINPNNPNSSAIDQAGSDKGPAAGNAGQPNAIDYQALYTELEKKLGDQGRELGEYRTFFEQVAPILDKLDQSPEMVQAIVDNKLDGNIARAALEGKLTINDVKIVDKAYTEVKKDLGNKAYEKSSVEEISKLVEAKVGEVEEKMQETLRENEDLRNFESKVKDFVERTSDFPNYAHDIEKWLDEHNDITDIEVAYYAVKGQLSAKEASEAAEKDRAEYAKNQALNAGGGTVRSTYTPEGEVNIVDQLIAGKSNPNVF